MPYDLKGILLDAEGKPVEVQTEEPVRMAEVFAPCVLPPKGPALGEGQLNPANTSPVLSIDASGVKISGTPVLAEGTKFDGGKIRFDLLPTISLREVAKVYTMGAAKYADRNWEKGILFHRVYGALLRHLTSWWDGETYATDDGQHHLASVAWCALALLHYDLLPERYKSFDDRPTYTKGGEQSSTTAAA